MTVSIDVLIARGASVTPCGGKRTAALHSEAKKRISAGRIMSGEREAAPRFPDNMSPLRNSEVFPMKAENQKLWGNAFNEDVPQC